ncbi:MAG: autotransporter-associated beta strand repeat-containing protein [Candidatus Didemnitutus sp.]|nr:autotransporter-associated beta strand repeat-containing protein [Candidatus Didemnitutus sp.]
MKRVLLVFLSLGALSLSAQPISYTSTSAIGNWGTARWNNSADGPSYVSAYTANQNVNFTSGTYRFAGMGSTINVGNITVASGVTVNFTSASGTLATGGNVRTIDVGSGGLVRLGSQAIATTAGTGFIKTGAGTLFLAGSAYPGGFTLNAGTVIVGGVNALGNGSLTINGGTIGSDDRRDLSGKFAGGITVGGDFQLGAPSYPVNATLKFSNAMNFGGATRTLTIGGNASYTLGGVISNGGLTVNLASGATGQLDLTAVNSYEGATTIFGGTVRANIAGALGSAAGSVTVSGGTLNLSGYSHTKGQITLSSGTLSGGTMSSSIGFELQSGSAHANLSGTGAVSKTTSGTITLTGNNEFSGGMSIADGTVLAYSNNALGSGAVSITGGTLSLAASYVTVGNAINIGASGTLMGTDAAAVTGSITGTGTLAGTLNLAAGANVNAGNSPGILHNIGTLTFSSDSTLTWELGALSTADAGTHFDQIANTGTINLNGGMLALSLGSFAPSADPFWASDRSWTVIYSTAGGSTTGTALGIASDQSGWASLGSFGTSLIGQDMVLSWTAAAIPETSTYAAIFGALALAGVCVHRRRQARR